MMERPEPYLDKDLTDRKNEEWVDIINYDGYYQVSSHGRIKSLDRIDSAGNRRKGVVLSQGICKKDNAARVSLCMNGIQKSYLVASLMAYAFLSKKMDGLDPENIIMHINKKAYDNRLCNLKVVSLSDSCKRDYELGTKKKGKGLEMIIKIKAELNEIERNEYKKKFCLFDENGKLIAKICTECLKEKPIEEFGHTNNHGKRHPLRRRVCSDCRTKKDNPEIKNPGKNRASVELAKKYGMRRCTVCKEIKSLDDFYNMKKVFMGKNYVCKECHKKIKKNGNEKESHKRTGRENRPRADRRRNLVQR